MISNLRKEMNDMAERDQCDPARLGRGEDHGEDGRERREKVLRYVVNRPREHKLYSGEKRAEIVLLDGTGSGTEPPCVRVSRPRASLCGRAAGAIVQLTSTTNSKYRLLYRKGAAEYRKNVAEMIRHLRTIYGDKLLVGSSMTIEEKLVEDGALEGVLSLHFGAERGINWPSIASAFW